MIEAWLTLLQKINRVESCIVLLGLESIVKVRFTPKSDICLNPKFYISRYLYTIYPKLLFAPF